ncbi:hypothetical protein UCRPC4_g02419 [Phaeomoniella chlamydospora]|uniref:DUF1740-domain-containing protein n=1 Tax=Phaeomoniella chlamydospora TaxID=158046 RepID=A0A0G2EQQ1_PHACM|nr:hypothetical protein UCRPC4_g02419 [Phaeomoniella chlamydospora]
MPSVPKFASFKPRTPLETAERLPDSEKDQADNGPRRRSHEGGNLDRRNGHSSYETRRRKDQPDRQHRSDANSTHGRRSQERIDQSDNLADGIFFQDRLGDPDNVIYGKLHRYAIPRYRQRGYGNILGLDRQFRMASVEDEGSRLVSSKLVDDTARPHLQSLTSVNYQLDPMFIRAKDKTSHMSSEDSSRNFIALEGEGQRKRRRTDSESSTENNLSLVRREKKFPNASEIRSFERSAQALENDEQEDLLEAVPAQSADLNFEDPEKAARLRLHELHQAVKGKATNLDAWMTLINHHDQTSFGSTKSISNSEKIALADIKLSLYEEALVKVKESAHRETLVLGMLKEGAKIWDTRKLASKWQRILQENTKSPRLWLEYLEFFNTNILVYRYDTCRSLFLEAAKAIHTSDDEKKNLYLVYVFLRMTRTMHDSGFTEYSLALWQAILEITFLGPQTLSYSQRRDYFTRFWESEAPRIGEVGAKGWRYWMNENEKTDVEPVSDDLGSPLDGHNLFATWSKAEVYREKTAEFPARTLDDVAEDDPYRVILFSDLEDTLDAFRLDKLENTSVLIEAFLKFCDLPPMERAYEQSIPWTDDQLLRTSLFCASNDIPYEQLDFFLGASDTSSLFSATEWMSVWPKRFIDTAATKLWKQRALQLLVENMPLNDRFAEYVIGYVFSIDPKESRKYAKATLKRRSSSLRLYNAYALLELRIGNIETAERTWSTALSMSKQFAEEEQKTDILLWDTWIWECLDRGKITKAMELILSIPVGSVDLKAQDDTVEAKQSTRLLKTRRHLQSLISHSTTFKTDLLPHYLSCLSLLEYLHNAESLPIALSQYTPDHYPNASIAQSIARLLHYHWTTHPYSPSYKLSTSTLFNLLQYHPSNTILLNLHTRLTHHINLFDRLRSTSPPPTTLTTHLHKIRLELQRPTYGGGTSNSIRSAFENALSSYPHSPLLYTLYLRFELQNSLEKATQLYHRGLRLLPWHKGFAMLGFIQDRLREKLEMGNELRSIWEGMGERGMRMRVGIEDLLEERDGD